MDYTAITEYAIQICKQAGAWCWKAITAMT